MYKTLVSGDSMGGEFSNEGDAASPNEVFELHLIQEW
jgi:hypothetical protein